MAEDKRLTQIFQKNLSVSPNSARQQRQRERRNRDDSFGKALLASRYDVSFNSNHHFRTEKQQGDDNSTEIGAQRRKSRANLSLSMQATNFLTAGRNPNFSDLTADMILQYQTAAMSMLNLARDPRVSFDRGTIRRFSLLGTVPNDKVRMHCVRAFYLLSQRPKTRSVIIEVQSARYLINMVFRMTQNPCVTLCVAGTLCFLTCAEGEEEALIDQGILHGIQKLMNSEKTMSNVDSTVSDAITRYCSNAVFNLCCAKSLSVNNVPNLVDIIVRSSEMDKVLGQNNGFNQLMVLRALCNLSERFCDAVLENKAFGVVNRPMISVDQRPDIQEAVVATICNAAIQLAGPLRVRMIMNEKCIERLNSLCSQMNQQTVRVQELISMTYRKLARDEGSWHLLIKRNVIPALQQLAPLEAVEVKLNVAHALMSLVQSQEFHDLTLVKDATGTLRSLVDVVSSDTSEVLTLSNDTAVAQHSDPQLSPPGGGTKALKSRLRRQMTLERALDRERKYTHDDVRQLCANILSLLQSDPIMVRNLIEHNVFTLLERILEGVDIKIPEIHIGEMCCRVIYNCCCCNSLQLEKFMTDGIFSFLLEIISDGSFYAKELASGALWRFMHLSGDTDIEMEKVNRIVQVLDGALHQYERDPPRTKGKNASESDQAKYMVKSNVLGTVCAIVRYHFNRMTLESKKKIAAEMITFCKSEDQPVTLANVASVLCVLSQSNIETGGKLFEDDSIAQHLLPAIMKPISIANNPDVTLLCVITISNMSKDERLAMMIVNGKGSFNEKKQGYEMFLQSMVKASLSYGGQENLKLGVAIILATLSQYNCELELMNQSLATEIMTLGLLHDTRNKTSIINKKLCAIMLHNIITALLPGDGHSIGPEYVRQIGPLKDSESFAWALCNLSKAEEEETRLLSMSALANLSSLEHFLGGICHNENAVKAMIEVCEHSDCSTQTRQAVANLVYNMCHHEQGINVLESSDRPHIITTLLENLEVGREIGDVDLQLISSKAMCALAYVGCETSRNVFLEEIMVICEVVRENPTTELVQAVAQAMTATAFYSPGALVAQGEVLVKDFFDALRLILSLKDKGLDSRDFCISILHHLTAEEKNLPHLIDYGALELMQEVIENELQNGGVFSTSLINWCVELMHNLALGKERAAKMVSLGVCQFVSEVLSQPNANEKTIHMSGEFVHNLCQAQINTNRLCRDNAFKIIHLWIKTSDAEETNIHASAAIRKLVGAIANHQIAANANVIEMTMKIFQQCDSEEAKTNCAATLARLAVNEKLVPIFTKNNCANVIRSMSTELPSAAKRYCLAALCTLSRYDKQSTVISEDATTSELSNIASSIMNLVFTTNEDPLMGTAKDDITVNGAEHGEIGNVVSMLQHLETEEAIESVQEIPSVEPIEKKSSISEIVLGRSAADSRRRLSLSQILQEQESLDEKASLSFGIDQLAPPFPFKHEKYSVQDGMFENDLASLSIVSFEPDLTIRPFPMTVLKVLGGDNTSVQRYITSFEKYLPKTEEIFDDNAFSFRETSIKAPAAMSTKRPQTSPELHHKNDMATGANAQRFSHTIGPASAAMAAIGSGFQRNTSAEHFKKLISMLDRQESSGKEDRFRSQSSSFPSTIRERESKSENVLGHASTYNEHQHNDDLPPLAGRGTNSLARSSISLFQAHASQSEKTLQAGSADQMMASSSQPLFSNPHSPKNSHSPKRKISNKYQDESITKVHPLVQKSFTTMFHTSRSDAMRDPLAGINKAPITDHASAGSIFFQQVEKKMQENQSRRSSNMTTNRESDFGRNRAVRNSSSRNHSRRHLERSKTGKSLKSQRYGTPEKQQTKDGDSWASASTRFDSPIDLIQYKAKYKYNLDLKKAKSSDHRTGSRESRRVKRSVKFDAKKDRHRDTSSRYSHQSGRSTAASSHFHQPMSNITSRKQVITEIGDDQHSEHSDCSEIV